MKYLEKSSECIQTLKVSDWIFLCILAKGWYVHFFPRIFATFECGLDKKNEVDVKKRICQLFFVVSRGKTYKRGFEGVRAGEVIVCELFSSSESQHREGFLINELRADGASKATPSPHQWSNLRIKWMGLWQIEAWDLRSTSAKG